jgi:hypothetical protein
MPVSDSGRVLVEIDPTLKRELYCALEREGLTLKEWFTCRANQYVADSIQLSLRFSPVQKEPSDPVQQG